METINFKNFKWIDIENPDKADIKFLEKKFKFHHLALEDCLSTVQRPKLDEYDDHLFMVFHLPRHIKESRRTINDEIDVFLGKNYLVTLHKKGFKPIDALFKAIQQKDTSIITESPAYLLYELLDKSFDFCFPMTDKIGQRIDLVENLLYRDQSRRTLEEITLLERDIINFRRIVGPQIRVMKDLETLKVKFIGEELELYFDDIVDKIERINELLNSYKEVCEALQRTNESILTQRLNEIIKILTIFSVIMLPLTVITGFYGMNVSGLPLADYKYASELIIVILFGTIVGMLSYFSKKRWL